jgi:hypothetical protein
MSAPSWSKVMGWNRGASGCMRAFRISNSLSAMPEPFRYATVSLTKSYSNALSGNVVNTTRRP